MNKHPFHSWINLEQPRLGTKVTFATDEFFAAKERIIDPADPVFIEGKYDDHGKWMDGWESQRRRDGGHDWCLIRLGARGLVRGVDMDTAHFTGNYPPAASLWASDTESEPGEADWTEIVPSTDLGPSAHHFAEATAQGPWRWLRVNMYPDGGIARLRVGQKKRVLM